MPPQGLAVSCAFTIELTHFAFCFYGIWNTGVDRYYLRNTFGALPTITLMSFGIYLGWHILIIALSAKMLLRGTFNRHALAHP
jgi:hypothetical protein